MTDTLLDIALTMAKRSTCTRAQVGCVVALEGRILTTGYNGAPSGVPHCDHTCGCHSTDLYHTGSIDSDSCKLNDTAGCVIAVHAEANAIAFAAKNGIALLGSTLFTTLSPCLNCVNLIINAGVWHVVVEELYRDTSGLELLKQVGISVTNRLGRSLWP